MAKVFSFNFLKSVYVMDDSIKLVCKETSLEVFLGDTSLPTASPLKAYSHLVGKKQH